jgi:glycosyltransferase involved in cell wall biosynthesis
MVTHSFYESDNRVLRYAEALIDSGSEVDVYALRASEGMKKAETIHGVNVYRIQDRFGKSQVHSLAYLWPLLQFLARSFFRVTRADRKRPYDLIHVHNIPDFMIFSAVYPKSHGTRTILDIHDIIPEFFGSKFGTESRGIVFRLLLWMEKISASLADEVIIANDLWLERYMTRTGTEGRCRAMINYVDAQIFKPRPRTRKDGKLIVLFPGGLQHHQGVDIAIRAFGQIADELPLAEFHIYGDGSAKRALADLVAELGLGERVRFFQTLRIRDIAAVVADADLGVVPKRADSFGNEAYSTKIMEFMASGVPVIVSGTRVDRYYFDDSVVRFFESGNVDALAREMRNVLKDEELRREISKRALEFTVQNSWERQKGRYLDLVDCLTS